MTDAPAGFAKMGIQGIEHAIEKSKRGDFVETEWFRWDDGEKKIIRFLTDMDKIITVTNHENVVRANGKRMSFVCRKENPADRTAAAAANTVVGCELCELWERTKDLPKDKRLARPRELCWGLGVWRQEMRDENNRIKGYADVVEQVKDDQGNPVMKDDGTPQKKPVVGIIRQAVNNFWLQPKAFFERYGTLRDRDYEVIRHGADLETKYTIVPCDPLEIENIDVRYEKFTPDLGGILTRLSSQEYYDKQLRGEGTTNGEASANGEASTSAASVPDDQTEFDRIAAERQKLADEAVTGGY